jgi:hypothetical protein
MTKDAFKKVEIRLVSILTFTSKPVTKNSKP